MPTPGPPTLAIRAILLATLLAAAAPARAEYPLAVAASIGAGAGAGTREELKTEGTLLILDGDLMWRMRPGRSLVASVDLSGNLSEGSAASVWQRAMTLGYELSRPPGGGVAGFVRGGLGAAAITSSREHRLYLSNGAPGRPLADLTEVGVALSMAAGIWLVPRPGPLGFQLAWRSSNAFARHSRISTLGLAFGVCLWPRAGEPSGQAAEP